MHQPTFYPIQLKTGETIELPRVSHILSEINKQEYVGKRQFYGNGTRAAIGTQADAMICRIISGAIISKDEWNTTDEKVKNAVRAYIRWQQTTGFKPRFTHIIVYSLKHGIAGELDFGGLIKNCMTIVEAKTGELHPDLHLMQLVIYMKCYMEMYPTKRLSELRLVRFNMDTGNFEEIRLSKEQANQIFERFLAYKNNIIEWDGAYKHSAMSTNQKELKEAVMVSQNRSMQIYAQQENPELKKKTQAMIQSLWPQAPAIEIAKAVWLCMTYGLDPLRKHVALVPFANSKTGKDDWVAIIEIQADRDMAAQGGAYSYIDDTPRAMTNAEQIKIFGEVVSDKICAITKLQYGNVIANGYGTWPRNKQPYGVEKGNSAINMAMIRSERQALHRLPNKAQLPPSDIEVMDGAYLDTPDFIPEQQIPAIQSAIATAEPEATGEAAEAVDGQTGEILPVLPLGGKYGDMRVTCWQHSEDWVRDPKKAQYGNYWHRDGKGFCKIRERINEVKELLLSKVGTDGTDLNDLTKNLFEGKAWSKLLPEQQVQVLDAYYESHLESFGVPEQARMAEV